MAFNCYNVIIYLDRKPTKVLSSGLGRWLNAKLNTLRNNKQFSVS